MRKNTVKTDQAKHSAETHRHRGVDGVWWNEVCCFVEACTCMDLYIPVCTSMYLWYSKFENFWNLTLSHSIPCMEAVKTLIYLSCLFLGQWENYISFKKYVLVRTGMYCLVQMWNSHTVMYRHVLVCTSTNCQWYWPFCQILSRCTTRTRTKMKMLREIPDYSIDSDVPSGAFTGWSLRPVK